MLEVLTQILDANINKRGFSEIYVISRLSEFTFIWFSYLFTNKNYFLDLSQFRIWCVRFHEEIDSINNIIETQNLGILCLLLHRFKEDTLPESERLLDIIHMVLPV